MPQRRWTLPLALGLITAILLVAALWPKAPPKRTVVVAARDLGAGAALAAADLTTVELDAPQAPADAVGDPGRLVGQTLAVVRFAGEPITPRSLGPAVTLAPDERGLAVKVKADTGLAGLLRPGMQVGVIATLTDSGTARDVYAKTVLEGLRVLYVSPDFQARPYTPATASATVNKSGSSGTGSGLGLDNAPATSSTGSSGTVREGVLVLAVSTQAQPIRYETTLPLTQTISARAGVTETLKLAATLGITNTAVLTPTVPAPPTPTARAAVKPAEPPVRWVAPVELLAALNAGGDSLTLTLLPAAPQAYITAGANLSDVRPPSQEAERRP
jgi:Flp pilus assembly protein CpaB